MKGKQNALKRKAPEPGDCDDDEPGESAEAAAIDAPMPLASDSPPEAGSTVATGAFRSLSARACVTSVIAALLLDRFALLLTLPCFLTADKNRKKFLRGSGSADQVE